MKIPSCLEETPTLAGCIMTCINYSKLDIKRDIENHTFEDLDTWQRVSQLQRKRNKYLSLYANLLFYLYLIGYFCILYACFRYTQQQHQSPQSQYRYYLYMDYVIDFCSITFMWLFMYFLSTLGMCYIVSCVYDDDISNRCNKKKLV